MSETTKDASTDLAVDKGERVTFVLDGGEFVIEHQGDRVRVRWASETMATDMAVTPRTSNVVELRPAQERTP